MGLKLSRKLPREVEELKKFCWVCDKFDKKPREVHIVCGGLVVGKMCEKQVGKITHLFMRYAPIGCFLAHDKKGINDFYKDKEWMGWKNVKTM